MAVTFDASQPQRILLADGTHIYIPANAMPMEGRVTLHVVPIATLPHQRHADVYRYGYGFTAVGGKGSPSPSTLTRRWSSASPTMKGSCGLWASASTS